MRAIDSAFDIDAVHVIVFAAGEQPMSIVDTIHEKLKAAPADLVREVLDFVEFLETRSQRPASAPARSWDEVADTLKGSELFEGDPLEIQRKLRAEWD